MTFTTACTAGDSTKDDDVMAGEDLDETDVQVPTDVIVDAWACCASCTPQLTFSPNAQCANLQYNNGGVITVPGFGDVTCAQLGGVGALICTYEMVNPEDNSLLFTYGCEPWDEAVACDVQDADGVEWTGEDLCDACEEDFLDSFFGTAAAAAAFDAAIDAVCGGDIDPQFQPLCFAQADPIELDHAYDDDCTPGATRTGSGADVDFVLIIDPNESFFAVHDSGSTPIISSAISGTLFAGQGPARLLAGSGRGADTTYAGVTWSNIGVGFLADIDLDFVNNTMDIDPGEAGGIWWSGYNSQTSARQAWDLSPSQGASGPFDLASGTWALTYTQTTTLGVATVHLEGGIASD